MYSNARGRGNDDPKPSTAEQDIHAKPCLKPKTQRRADEATKPRTEHRGARHHSKSDRKLWIQRRAAETTTPRTEHGKKKSCPAPWIQRRAVNAATSPNRAPRGAKTFKIRSSTMDSKARGRGNDAPNRAPWSTKYFKIRSKTMDSTAGLSLILISEPTRLSRNSYAVSCLHK